MSAVQPFQVMPPLAEDEYAALRDDIAEHGILVPVMVDQHGRTIDGHHRQRIAAELGVDCPTEVHHVDDDEGARQVALTLNLARRHLSREQRRELIRAELEARPGDSDRAIARRFGCDHKTVGSVRREGGEVPHPDVLDQAWSDDLAVEDAVSGYADLVSTRGRLSATRGLLRRVRNAADAAYAFDDLDDVWQALESAADELEDKLEDLACEAADEPVGAS